MQKLKNVLLGLIIPVIIVLLWWFLTNFTDTPETILPKISSVFAAAQELWSTGSLQEDLSISLQRVILGYLASAAIGLILGTVTGMIPVVKKLLNPTLTTIRQIPLMAWIPLIILWCGIGEGSKIIIIVIGAVFPIYVNTQAGIASTPQEYIEVAKLYKLNTWQTFTRVYLPHALPSMQTGLKLGLGTAWMAVVAAELIAATSGIGYKMSYARTLMQSDRVILYMILIGLIGIIMDKILGLIFYAVTPWERKGKGKDEK